MRLRPGRQNGDGNIDEPTENCDDGNAVSGDGRSAPCLNPTRLRCTC